MAYNRFFIFRSLQMLEVKMVLFAQARHGA